MSSSQLVEDVAAAFGGTLVGHWDRELDPITSRSVTVTQLSGDRVVGADRRDRMQDLVVDDGREFLPPSRFRQRHRPVGFVLPAMQLEHSAIGRGRQVEGDASSNGADYRIEGRLIGCRADQRLHAHLDLSWCPASPSRTLGDRGEHRLVDEARGADRVESNPVGHLAGHGAHPRTDRRDMDRDVGVIDRARIEERHHQAEVVVLAFELQRSSFLPAGPHRPDRTDGVSHPRRRRVPLHTETPPDVTAHLGAEAEKETTTGEFRQRPRRHRGRRRRSGKSHRHRGAKLDSLRGRRPEGK